MIFKKENTESELQVLLYKVNKLRKETDDLATVVEEAYRLQNERLDAIIEYLGIEFVEVDRHIKAKKRSK